MDSRRPHANPGITVPGFMLLLGLLAIAALVVLILLGL